MKKLFLGVAAVAAMMFVACDSDSGTSANDSPAASQESSSSSVKESSSSHSELVSESSSSSSESVDPESPQGDESSSANSSSSASKYVCDIYDLADALSCDCDASREDSLAYNYDSEVELVCIYDDYLDKWGWVTKKAASSSSSVDPESPQGDESSSSDSGELSESSSSVIVYEGMACDKEGSRYYASWDEDGSWYICRNGIYVWELPLNDGEYSGVTYDSIIDARDGQVYKTVVINGVTVFAQNLNYGKMVPGSDSSDNQSDDSVVEKYCYNDSVKFCNRFGGLYQWAEALGLPSSCNTSSAGACAVDTSLTYRGACPEGWHVPNKLEYAKMRGINTAGTLKSSLYWYNGTQSGNGTNSSGFTMLPSGWRDTGAYAYLYEDSYLWITDFKNDLYSYKIGTLINSTMPDISISQKVMGMAVRCFKD